MKQKIALLPTESSIIRDTLMMLDIFSITLPGGFS